MEEKIVIPRDKERRIHVIITFPSLEATKYERNILCSRKKAVELNKELKKCFEQYQKLILDEDKIKFADKFEKK